MRVIECISFNRMLDYDVNKTIKLETAVKIGCFRLTGGVRFSNAIQLICKRQQI